MSISLKENCPLRKLALGWNGLETKGGSFICSVLGWNNHLEVRARTRRMMSKFREYLTFISIADRGPGAGPTIAGSERRVSSLGSDSRQTEGAGQLSECQQLLSLSMFRGAVVYIAQDSVASSAKWVHLQDQASTNLPNTLSRKRIGGYLECEQTIEHILCSGWRLVCLPPHRSLQGIVVIVFVA